MEVKAKYFVLCNGKEMSIYDVNNEEPVLYFKLGEASKKVMVSSTKGNTGHLLGAAGVVEALICAKAIEEQLVPPTLNYKVPDEECDLDIVPNELRSANLNVVMSNSLGFGGHNASIILKKYEEEK